jgi:hypothetical protein
MTAERAYNLFRKAIAEAGDPVTADALYNRAKEELRQLGSSHIPRLKVVPERPNAKWWREAPAILERVGYLTDKYNKEFSAVSPSQKNTRIKNDVQCDPRWPGMSDDTYYRIINASSGCDHSGNERLPKAK